MKQPLDIVIMAAGKGIAHEKPCPRCCKAGTPPLVQHVDTAAQLQAR